MRKFFLILIGLGLFMGWGVPVRAATQAEADLYPADASAFPTISTFLDVFDASGRFVSGLKPEQVTILEDRQPLGVKSFNEMVVPLQLVVAVNPGPAFGVRNQLGTQRFDAIHQALRAWAQALPADTPDDMSLVTITGPIIAHASAKDWLVSLDTFQPDFHATTPNLQSLQLALETVAVPGPRVGMKRAVLFITPHMDDPDLANQLQPLIDRAVQNRVRVFVWFSDVETYAATTSAAAFSTLATATGGAYFGASDTAPYPDPEGYFAPLRRLYALQYDSMVKSGGPHTVSVDVRGQTGEVQSSEQSFNVDLQPPNPIVVSPQLQITRQPPQDDPFNGKVLLPDAQQINIIVEFPDGHTRPLVRTTLYVDGQIAAENKSAPFDSFAWDLRQYKQSGEHKLVVEAVDDLNLSKMSMELPVSVTVIEAPHGIQGFFGRYRQMITYGAVGLAGFVLVGILFVARFRNIFTRRRTEKQVHSDPVTQPVPVVLERPNGNGHKNGNGNGNGNGKNGSDKEATKPNKRVRIAKDAPNGEPPAWLQRLISDPLAAPGETFKAAPVSPIPLIDKEITFGTDPVQSLYVLDDPSLAPRHARIQQTDAGQFLVSDAGTIAGTWVNFEPVGKEGHPLRHGDVVHFGQLIYRFELKDPPPLVEPKIEKQAS
ncbi:MAG: FHA domain-containing protein [Anaerolineae bacterium]